jgi:hypothetical protein
MEKMVLASVLLVVPGMTLIYLAARLIAVAVKLFRTGHVVESLLLLVAALVAATLVAMFGNEKSILVAALLSWVFLAVAFIRFVLRNGENDPRQQSYFSDPPHDQDPNSLNFSGVGPRLPGLWDVRRRRPYRSGPPRRRLIPSCLFAIIFLGKVSYSAKTDPVLFLLDRQPSPLPQKHFLPPGVQTV